MSVDLNAIEARLQSVICPTCARYTSEGTCSLPPQRTCSLFRNLPTIVDIVRKTHAQEVAPYADVLRRRVCVTCPHEDGHGNCPMRDGVDCALDMYLPIAIDEIELELARQRRLRAQASGHRKPTQPTSPALDEACRHGV